MPLGRWRDSHSFVHCSLSCSCGLGTRDSAVTKTLQNPAFAELMFQLRRQVVKFSQDECLVVVVSAEK